MLCAPATGHGSPQPGSRSFCLSEYGSIPARISRLTSPTLSSDSVFGQGFLCAGNRERDHINDGLAPEIAGGFPADPDHMRPFVPVIAARLMMKLQCQGRTRSCCSSRNARSCFQGPGRRWCRQSNSAECSFRLSKRLAGHSNERFRPLPMRLSRPAWARRQASKRSGLCP